MRVETLFFSLLQTVHEFDYLKWNPLILNKVVLTRIAVFAARTPHARGVCAGPVKAAAVALAGNATRSVSEEKSQ